MKKGKETAEERIIKIIGLYYAVLKDLYGKEIADLVQKRVNSLADLSAE